jgi:hypothetical protein
MVRSTSWRVSNHKVTRATVLRDARLWRAPQDEGNSCHQSTDERCGKDAEDSGGDDRAMDAEQPDLLPGRAQLIQGPCQGAVLVFPAQWHERCSLLA